MNFGIGEFLSLAFFAAVAIFSASARGEELSANGKTGSASASGAGAAAEKKFSLKAPNAKVVEINAEWSKSKLPMQRAEDGTWSATLETIPAGVWTYSFLVDGLNVPDPANAEAYRHLVFDSEQNGGWCSVRGFKGEYVLTAIVPGAEKKGLGKMPRQLPDYYGEN